MLADLQARCAPQSAERRLCPRIKPAEPDAGQGCTRSGLSLSCSAARVQGDLSTLLTYRTQNLNLKLQRGGVQNQISMDGEQAVAPHRTQQDPTHAHFSARTSPRGGRTGAKQPQPLLSRADVELGKLSVSHRGPARGNHVTAATVPARARVCEPPRDLLARPQRRDEGAEPRLSPGRRGGE